MINLIPPNARKKVLTEYWVRVVSVWLLIFSITCLLVSLIFLPVYVLVNSQIGVYTSSATEANSKITEFNNSASTITSVNSKAQKLFSLMEVEDFSEVIVALEAVHGKEIVIDGLTFERQGTDLNTLMLNGFANDRKSLADFRANLLALPNVKEVNLPISNLAKDKNIIFAITITFKEDKK